MNKLECAAVDTTKKIKRKSKKEISRNITKTKWTKICPNNDCGKLQTYSSKYKLQRALHNNSFCKICTAKLQGENNRTRKNLVGNQYGRLIVTKLHERKNSTPYWLCKCDCGNETVVRHGHLTGQYTKSCGCSHLYIKDKNLRWSGYGEISGTYFNQTKKSANKRNLVFDITIEYMWELFLKQNKRCALSGEILCLGTSQKNKDQTASLDRIDSTKGYVKGNIQWLHKDMNIMKLRLSDLELIKWCKKVSDYRMDVR